MIPKYKKVCAYFEDYIKSNHLQFNDKLPTEKKIAEDLNVSRVTIQRALRELQEQKTIYRIQGSGSYVGTQEHPERRESRVIPMVLSRDSSISRFFEIIQGAEKFMQENSHFLNVHLTNDDENEEQHIINWLINRGFKDIIISPVRSDRNVDFFFKLMSHDIRLTFIDILPNGLSGNLVTSNNVMGGYLAARHLIDRGYKKIALFSSKTTTETTIAERICGFQLALKEADVAANPSWQVFFDIGDHVNDRLAKLMESDSPPDAIFAINDVTATHICAGLIHLGYKVPEDVAIMGYDNLQQIVSEVPLSTINQDFYQIGYQAAKLCLEQINNNSGNLVKWSLPVSLVVRSST